MKNNQKRNLKNSDNSKNEGKVNKMPQSGLGSMQGENTRNMPSAVCASSINKSLDPTPI